MTTRTDKSVFTKVLELALCCCSEIPVPAAAKAHGRRRLALQHVGADEGRELGAGAVAPRGGALGMHHNAHAHLLGRNFVRSGGAGGAHEGRRGCATDTNAV